MKPKNKPAKRGKSRLNELERDEGKINQLKEENQDSMNLKEMKEQ